MPNDSRRVQGRRVRRRGARHQELQVPARLPQRPEPDRDHRRRRRRRPPLRRQVQPPDRGHRARPQGRAGRGRRLRAQAGRQAERLPRRPRRRHRAAQLPRPVLGLQQRLRARDQRLPRGPRDLALEPRVRRAHVHLGQRALRPRHGVRLGRLGHLPRLRARGALRALRHRGPLLRVVRQHDRLVGHRRQRRVYAPLEVPPQLHRASRWTRSRGGHPGMPQDCSKWENNQIYSNNNDLFNDKRDKLLQEHAEREARPAQGLPDLPGAGRHRHPDRRRQRQHLPQELDLRQLAARDDAVLGARASCAARTRPGNPPRPAPTRPRTTTSTSATGWASGPNGRRDPNGVDFWWDEEGGGNCWSGNEGPGGGAFTSDPTPLFACPTGSPNTRRQLHASRASCSPAPPGTRRRTPIRSAATGSSGRPSRSSARALSAGAGRRARGASRRSPAAAEGGATATWSGSASRSRRARRRCRATGC